MRFIAYIEVGIDTNSEDIDIGTVEAQDEMNEILHEIAERPKVFNTKLKRVD